MPPADTSENGCVVVAADSITNPMPIEVLSRTRLLCLGGTTPYRRVYGLTLARELKRGHRFCVKKTSGIANEERTYNVQSVASGDTQLSA
jgi:hypothetical protein